MLNGKKRKKRYRDRTYRDTTSQLGRLKIAMASGDGEAVAAVLIEIDRNVSMHLANDSDDDH